MHSARMKQHSALNGGRGTSEGEKNARVSRVRAVPRPAPGLATLTGDPDDNVIGVSGVEVVKGTSRH